MNRTETKANSTITAPASESLPRHRRRAADCCMPTSEIAPIPWYLFLRMGGPVAPWVGLAISGGPLRPWSLPTRSEPGRRAEPKWCVHCGDGRRPDRGDLLGQVDRGRP